MKFNKFVYVLLKSSDARLIELIDYFKDFD